MYVLMPSMGGTNIFHATLVISHATGYPIMCSSQLVSAGLVQRDFAVGLFLVLMEDVLSTVQSPKYNNKQCAVCAYHMTNRGLQSPDMA